MEGQRHDVRREREGRAEEADRGGVEVAAGSEGRKKKRQL